MARPRPVTNTGELRVARPGSPDPPGTGFQTTWSSWKSVANRSPRGEIQAEAGVADRRTTWIGPKPAGVSAISATPSRTGTARVRPHAAIGPCGSLFLKD